MTAKRTGQITALVGTYHSDLPNLTHIPHNHQCISNSFQLLQSAILKPPCCLLPPRSLRDLLGWAAYGQAQEKYRRDSQCQQPCCKMHPHLKTGKSFCSSTTGEWFHVKATTNCPTRNVVYLLECKCMPSSTLVKQRMHFVYV